LRRAAAAAAAPRPSAGATPTADIRSIFGSPLNRHALRRAGDRTQAAGVAAKAALAGGFDGVTGAIGVTAGVGDGGVPVRHGQTGTGNGAAAGAAGGGGGGGGGLRESDVRQAATIQDDIEALISEQELFAVMVGRCRLTPG
jgi:hypothetical protein